MALSPRDPAAMAAYASAVSEPGSSVFHRFLKVAQLRARFAPSDQQIAQVEASLRSEGLTPGSVTANGLLIPVTASAGRLERAFGVSFERVRLASGRTAYANTAAPRFNASVAGLIRGVIGLNTLALPQPASIVSPRRVSGAHSRVSGVRSHLRARDEPETTGGPQPCAAASSAAPGQGAYTANQLASAYNFTSLYGAGDEGQGIKVALVELEPNLTSDVAAYQSCYGTSATVNYVQVDGGASSVGGVSYASEATLDIEDVIGLAPDATIDVYQAPDNGAGEIYDFTAIVDDDTDQVISTSWGAGCDTDQSQALVDGESAIFEQAAIQGQSVFAAAGDSGSTACGFDTAPAVDDPASQPFVTGVGGLTLSSTSYPPVETVWNDAGGAGGGGISSNWAMPSYQSSAPASLNVINSLSSGSPCGAPSGSYCREVPDVSADADTYTGYLVYYDGSWQGIGGTSAAAPLWAAFTALVDASSSCGDGSNPIGFANPLLYNAAASAYSSDFTDVTSGNNDYTYDEYTGGLYPAGVGYDMASGLGSPNGATLPAALCTGNSGLTVASPGSQTSTLGTPVSLQIGAVHSPFGETLTYSASGLPAGLSINSVSGLISGAATTLGTGSVSVTVTDTSGDSGSTSFTWTVISDYTQRTLPFTGLVSPYGVAVDPAGDVFVTDQSGYVYELPAGKSQLTVPFTGLRDPYSVAVDAAGDVFVTNSGFDDVFELPGGESQKTLPFTGGSPIGVAVDAAGDVFVTVGAAVVELPAGGGPQRTLPFTGLSNPLGVAVDAAGDVFVTNYNNSTPGEVLELPAGSETQRTLPFTGLGYPSGVAVDAAGDVFVVDADNADVVELPAGGGPQRTLPFTGLSGSSGLSVPLGVAVDASGDVFVTDSDEYSGDVVELSPVAEPTSLSGSFSGGGQLGADISVPPGIAVSDQASLSGVNAATATGTVTYNVYSDDACTDLVSAGSAQTITPAGSLPASPSQTFSTPGTYYWQAVYGGDPFNAGSTNLCGSVVETVTATPTSVSTSLSGGGQSGAEITVAAGTAVSDAASLSGTNAAAASGTVTYTAFSDALCSDSVFADTEPVTAGSAAPSAGWVAGAPGTYYWVASYSGDGLNQASSSSCGSEVETVTAPACVAAPSITTNPSNQIVTAPAAATFTAAGSTPANCAAPSVKWSSEAPGATSFSAILGATSVSYTTPSTTTAQTGTKYEATFMNAFGSTTTGAATLTVNAPACAAAPSITTNPSNQIVTAPAAATFTAAGSTPANCAAPSVKWSSEAPGATSFSAIPGATSASYTTPATTTSENGTRYHATFTNAFGSTTTSPAALTVNPSTGPKIAAEVTATGTTTATASLSTATAGDLVVAFVAGDGPSSGGETATVSGGGLTWTLVGRTNTELGTSEIWSARATGTLSSAAIKASLSKAGGYTVSLTVIAYSGASGIGSHTGASARTGAPKASLTTTAAGSWVFAVGNDWDRAVDRTLGPNQTLVSEATEAAGDTYWVQSTTAPTASARTLVTISDTAPTTDRWNLELIDIL